MNFLRRGRFANGADVEQQGLASPSVQPEMREESRPRPRQAPRTRRVIPSRRDDGDRMQRLDGDGDGDDDADSPKTPRFNLGPPTLPGARLNLPHLSRTWTNSSDSARSRPSSAMPPNRPAREVLPEAYVARAEATQAASVAIPAPTARRAHSESRGRTGGFTGPDPAEMHLAQMAQEGRRRRRLRQRSQQGDGEGHPKRFLFCLPWVRSRRMRSQILRCLISGTFLALLLAVCE